MSWGGLEIVVPFIHLLFFKYKMGDKQHIFISLVIILLVRLPHLVRCASGTCGDTGEGVDEIYNLYMYNTSTAENIQLSFPDLLFSSFISGPVCTCSHSAHAHNQANTLILACVCIARF